MRPKVSVMMTTYNHEKYIGQAVSGALEQETDFDYEILVGEDCSTDRTREILLELQTKNPHKLRLLLREQNWGGRRNFVDTFMRCTGEYIALLEGDDYWTASDKLQKQVDMLDSHSELTICFHRVLGRHEASGKETLVPTEQPGRDRFTLRDILQRNFIPTCSVMFRNGLFGDFPAWFHTTPSGDWPLHILNALHGDIGYINEVMAVYRLHGGGVWSVRSPAEQKQRSIRILETLRENLGPELDCAITHSLARWKIRWLYSIARENSWLEAVSRVPSLLLDSDIPRTAWLRAGVGLLLSKARAGLSG